MAKDTDQQKLCKLAGAVAVHTFSPSIFEEEAGGSLEFEASLVYKVSSRTARVVSQRNPVSKTNKSNKTMQNSASLIDIYTLKHYLSNLPGINNFYFKLSQKVGLGKGTTLHLSSFITRWASL
ncbi:hypothetical protein ACRRTK_006538 [Alexandromys fortis]